MTCDIQKLSEKKYYVCRHFKGVSTETESVGHQDTQMDTDKPQSVRYAAISIQILLSHTTPDK